MTHDARCISTLPPEDAARHQDFLRQAVALSARGAAAGDGGPFGALVVCGGEVIGEGWNQVVKGNDPTAHAEVVAIRAACARLGRFHLQGCVLYASCEPCPMCLAAAYWARVDAIYFANTREDAAHIGFCDADLYCELALPAAERSVPLIRVAVDGALTPLKDWLARPGHVPY